MKRVLEIGLGVVTSIGGFLEVGSIATSAQAGARFGFQLVWAVVVGAASLLLLMEMCGRLAAVTGRTLADHLRERFGIGYFIVPLITGLGVSFLVLASEIGGTALALQFATGINYRLWAVPIAILGWLLLWKGTFGIVEQGTALLGLTALVFAVALVALHPSWLAIVRHAIPSAPTHDRANYWYLAVSIVGASISPYLVYFYSSGAIEDGWDASYVRLNRVVASVGNVFGGGLAVAVLAVAALVLAPRHIRVEQFQDIRQLLTPPLGVAGFVLLVCTLFITCFGATVEITLAIAYLLAQGFGWAWSEDARPAANARFALTYTVAIGLAAVPIAAGLDPLALTNFSALLTAASLPVTVIPLVVLMNDRDELHGFRNGWISNLGLGALSLLSIAVLIAAVPLAITGSH